MPKTTSSNTTRKEFLQWATIRLLDTLIKEGFTGMMSTFEFEVLHVHAQIIHEGGFKSEK